MTNDIYTKNQSIEEGLGKEIGEEIVTSNMNLNYNNDSNSDEIIHTNITMKNIKSFFNFNVSGRKENKCCKEFKFNTSVCPICLRDIKVGETIAYSENDECNHYYHKECVIPWFMKGNVSCPNCRRDFINFKKERKGCILCV